MKRRNFIQTILILPFAAKAAITQNEEPKATLIPLKGKKTDTPEAPMHRTGSKTFPGIGKRELSKEEAELIAQAFKKIA